MTSSENESFKYRNLDSDGEHPYHLEDPTIQSDRTYDEERDDDSYSTPTLTKSTDNDRFEGRDRLELSKAEEIDTSLGLQIGGIFFFFNSTTSELSNGTQ